MKTSVNYLIATWSGPRRTQYEPYLKDPAYFLANQIKALREVKHNLAQITIAIPINDYEPKGFTELVENLPKEINGAKVVWFRRPNVGLSYGSWSQMIYDTLGQFSHYILVEDDYYFPADHFDQIMLDMLEPTTGFLCGYVYQQNPRHAAVFCGMIPASVCVPLITQYGCLPHANNSEYGDAEMVGQIGASQSILRLGYRLKDWLGYYSTGFRQLGPPPYTEMFGNGGPLLMPVGDPGPVKWVYSWDLAREVYIPT